MGISCNPKGMGDQFYPFYGSEGCTWSRFKLNLSWNERVYQVDQVCTKSLNLNLS